MIQALRPQADQRREEARGGAGVADVDLGLGHRDLAAAALDPDGQRRFIGVDPEAELAQRGDHDAGVAAEQRATQGGRAPGQRREDERAVGDALGAGQRDTAAHRPGERHDGKFLGIRAHGMRRNWSR